MGQQRKAYQSNNVAYHWGAGKNHEFFWAPVHILTEAFDELLKGDKRRGAGGKLVQVMGVETVFACIQPIGIKLIIHWTEVFA